MCEIEIFRLLDDWFVDSTESDSIYRFLLPVKDLKNDQAVQAYIEKILGADTFSAKQRELLLLYQSFFEIICPVLYGVMQKRGKLWDSLCVERNKVVLGKAALKYIDQFNSAFRDQYDDLFLSFIGRLYHYLLVLYRSVFGDKSTQQLVEKCEATEDVSYLLSLGVEEGVVQLATEYVSDCLSEQLNLLTQQLKNNQR